MQFHASFVYIVYVGSIHVFCNVFSVKLATKFVPLACIRACSFAMLLVPEAVRSRVEQFLGWAMLARLAQCCHNLVSESSWKTLAVWLHQPLPPRRRRNIGIQIRQFGNLCLEPLRQLSNIISTVTFPIVSCRNGRFPVAVPLRRVRVEHITAWSPPLGRPCRWADLRDAFHTRGFDEVTDLFAMAPPASAVNGWRHKTRRALTSNLYVEVTCTTVRVLWRGFHVELLEQICDMYSDSSASASPTPSRSMSRSNSSGRRLRRQHAGLHDS